MKKGTKKAVAAAVGAGVAAVAATAGVVAARRARTPKVYIVARDGEEWSIRAAGAAAAASVHATKRAALDAARALARDAAPSELIIHRVDGTVQSRHGYAAS
jgi:hypothetical protein